MKRAARLKSKVKWQNKNIEHVKKKYQEEKEQRKVKFKEKLTKANLIRKNHIWSLKGRAYSAFYWQIYADADDEIDDKIIEIAYDECENLATMETMDSEEYIDIVEEESEDEQNIEQNIEVANEKVFDQRFDKIMRKDSKGMIQAIHQKLYDKCFYQGERSTKLNHFQEFCSSVYIEADSRALDLTFENISKIDRKVKIEDLPGVLEEKHEKYLLKEVKNIADKSTLARKILKYLLGKMNDRLILNKT